MKLHTDIQTYRATTRGPSGPKKLLVVVVGGGENQKYCIAQVQVLKFLLKSLSYPDSDLTLTFLTLT